MDDSGYRRLVAGITNMFVAWRRISRAEGSGLFTSICAAAEHVARQSRIHLPVAVRASLHTSQEFGLARQKRDGRHAIAVSGGGRAVDEHHVALLQIRDRDRRKILKHLLKIPAARAPLPPASAFSAGRPVVARLRLRARGLRTRRVAPPGLSPPGFVAAPSPSFAERCGHFGSDATQRRFWAHRDRQRFSRLLITDGDLIRRRVDGCDDAADALECAGDNLFRRKALSVCAPVALRADLIADGQLGERARPGILRIERIRRVAEQPYVLRGDDRDRFAALARTHEQRDLSRLRIDRRHAANDSASALFLAVALLLPGDGGPVHNHYLTRSDRFPVRRDSAAREQAVADGQLGERNPRGTVAAD